MRPFDEPKMEQSLALMAGLPLGTGASELVLLSQGYVTTAPLTFDLTERTLLARLKKWSWASRFKDFVKRSLNLPL